MIDSIYAINSLTEKEKERIYGVLIPPELFLRYEIDPETLKGKNGEKLVTIWGSSGLPFMRIEMKRKLADQDPVISVDLSDTHHRQIELSFIIINDVESERFNIDIDEEGKDTYFGTSSRNLKEEERAMAAGLAPGQVRKGLRLIGKFFPRMEQFVASLGKELYVLEPLTYHGALLYEKYGFGYLKGHRYMEEIHEGFLPGGILYNRLDNSTPFRRKGAERTIRGRSWAIHDGILGSPWDPPTMFKPLGTNVGVCTFPNAIY
jgi:hypothetical protein